MELVSLCYYLSWLVSEQRTGVFGLSHRQAGKFLGLTHQGAGYLLDVLADEGLIERVSVGTYGERPRASEWRWTGEAVGGE